jgi:hypothetical protein
MIEMKENSNKSILESKHDKKVTFARLLNKVSAEINKIDLVRYTQI